MKTCKQCGKEKSLEEFSRGRAICKSCRNLSMKDYYKIHRDECIERAKRWAEENPERKREINRKSNIKLHGTPSAGAIDSEEHKEAWREFMLDYYSCETRDEVNTLCETFLDSFSARVNTLPTEIEDILVDWEERKI